MQFTNNTAGTHKKLPWKFLFCLYAVLVICTSIVPVVDYIRRPPGSVYTGFSFESGGDIFYYMNLIEQARQGHALFQNFMTPEITAGGLFQPLFLTLGTLGRLLHVSNIVIWHILRVVLLFPLIVLLYVLVGKYYSEEKIRKRVVGLLFVVGSLYALSYESSFFLAVQYSPMTILTIITTAAFFLCFMSGQTKGYTHTNSLLLVLLSLFQAMMHPYVLLVWFSVAGTYLVVDFFLKGEKRSRTMWNITLLLFCAFVAGTYLYFEVYRNLPVYGWALRAKIFPWQWVDTLLFLFGWLPLVVLGCWKKLSFLWKNPWWRLALLWLSIDFLLSRSPYLYAGRLMFYLLLPLGLLAWFGIEVCFQKGKQHFRWYAFLIVFLTLSISNNLFHLGKGVTGNYALADFRYVDQPTQQLFSWFQNSTPKNAVILHGIGWDTELAWGAYRHVFSVAGGLTKEFGQRLEEVQAVYSGYYSPEELRRFLETNNVQYILVSPLEKKTGILEAERFHNESFATKYAFHFVPEKYPFLHLVYNQNQYAVYQFTKE